jgi:hypothetical protein
VSSVGNSVVSITGNPIIRNGVYDSTAGAGRYVTYGAIPAQRQWVTSGFTIAFWLNVAQSSFDGSIITIFDNCSLSPNPGGFYVVLDDRGGATPTNGFNIAFGTGTGGTTNRTGLVSNCVSNSTWEHFVIVCSTTGIAVYKNGAALSVTNSGSGTGYLPTFANMRFGGRSSDGGFPLQGMVKDTRFYTGQLSAQEISDLYANKTDQFLNEAYGLWLFDEASYDYTNKRVLDKTPNARHLTIGDGSTTTTFPTKLPRSGFSYDGGDYFYRAMSGVSDTAGTFSVRVTFQGLSQVPILMGQAVTQNSLYISYDTLGVGRVPSYNNVSTPGTTIGSVPIRQGTPTTLSVSWDSTTVYMYVDGVLFNSGARVSNTNFAAVSNLWLGQSGLSSLYQTGGISGAAFFTSVLTPLQHALLHEYLKSNSNRA